MNKRIIILVAILVSLLVYTGIIINHNREYKSGFQNFSYSVPAEYLDPRWDLSIVEQTVDGRVSFGIVPDEDANAVFFATNELHGREQRSIARIYRYDFLSPESVALLFEQEYGIEKIEAIGITEAILPTFRVIGYVHENGQKQLIALIQHSDDSPGLCAQPYLMGNNDFAWEGKRQIVSIDLDTLELNEYSIPQYIIEKYEAKGKDCSRHFRDEEAGFNAVSVGVAKAMTTEVLEWIGDYKYDENVHITEVLSDSVARGTDAVYYKYYTRLDDESTIKEIRAVEGIDARSTEILTYDDHTRILKDSEKVYYKRSNEFVVMEGVDPASLTIENPDSIENLVAQDNSYYIFAGSYDKEKQYILADKESFTVLDGPFAKDKDYLYVSHYSTYEKIDEVDIESMRMINYRYLVDKNNVYGLMYHWEWATFEELESADPNKFQFVHDSLAKDNDNVYHNTQLISEFEIDAATFTVLDTESKYTSLYSDKDALYYFQGNSRTRIDDVDIKTVESMNAKYPGMNRTIWKDKNGLYTIIENVVDELTGQYSFEVVEINVDRESVADFAELKCSEISVDVPSDYGTFCIRFTDKNGAYVIGRNSTTLENGHLELFELQ